MITVSFPTPNDTTKVNPNTEICANGTASGAKETEPAEVRGYIYQTAPAVPPDSPPIGSTAAALDHHNWSISNLPGATGGTAPNLPTNYLVVWARYSSTGTWVDRGG